MGEAYVLVVAEASSKTLVLSFVAFTVKLSLLLSKGFALKNPNIYKVTQGGLCYTKVNTHLEKILMEISRIQMLF